MRTHSIKAARMAACMLAAVMLAGLAATASAATLNPKLLPNVKAATFEVVAAKAGHDPLSYEKPLPVDLIPYQRRTDKYHSIGTAFAIGHGRYVTAGHVLLTGRNSLWGPPALRDAAGHVYAIDQIEKFSYEKDFVVFTVKGKPGKAALKIDTHPQLNQTVYAVGNALGTGIVIRSGLYTSDTPEQQNGRWKWIRFSAAASPGNSGGPLLDENGKVIGVVLMKSANENLNYALPMSEVLKAPDHVAEADKRIPYGFDVFNESVNHDFKAKFTLPKSLSAFFAAFDKRMQAYEQAQLDAVLAKHPKRMFPRGDGSGKLLHGIASSSDFPALIVRDSNDEWKLTHGGHRKKVSLHHNGHVAIALYKHDILFRVRTPDSTSSSSLYQKPARIMDLVLKTGLLGRHVGSERVRITSLGKPSSTATHVDKWQRRWLFCKWPVPYGDGYALMLALPTPDGYVGLINLTNADDVHDYAINLKALSDFMYVNYDGKLSQWKTFLADARQLPAAFKNIHVDIDYGHRFRYRSPRMHFTVTPKLQKVQADSMLKLGFAFFRNQSGKVVWNVGAVRLKPQADDEDMISIVRNEAPSGDLGDSYKHHWDKVLHRSHPYDAVVQDDGDVTKISSVVGAKASAKPKVLYTAFYHAEGTHPKSHMKQQLDRLLGNLDITDPQARPDQH